MKYKLLFSTVLLLLTSCAGIMNAWREQNCNYSGAYSAGMNEGRRGGRMTQNFAGMCPVTVRAEAERGYREGYTAGIGGQAQAPAFASANHAQDPDWKCVNAYGQKECGYACTQAFGKVACGTERGDNCVEAFGDVRCGRNCRAEYGTIHCD